MAPADSCPINCERSPLIDPCPVRVMIQANNPFLASSRNRIAALLRATAEQDIASGADARKPPGGTLLTAWGGCPQPVPSRVQPGVPAGQGLMGIIPHRRLCS